MISGHMNNLFRRYQPLMSSSLKHPCQVLSSYWYEELARYCEPILSGNFNSCFGSINPWYQITWTRLSGDINLWCQVVPNNLVGYLQLNTVMWGNITLWNQVVQAWCQVVSSSDVRVSIHQAAPYCSSTSCTLQYGEYLGRPKRESEMPELL